MSRDDDKQIPLDLNGTSVRKRPDQPVEESTGDSLEWTSHPAKKNSKVTVAVSFFIIVLIVTVYYATYSIWFATLGAAILLGSLASFYFPTRYRLTEDDITIKTFAQTHLKKWTQYRTYYPDKNGVLLSPFTRPTRLENYRGIYLRFWNNRDEVVDFVRHRLDNISSGE